jgi:hypothetical protein
MSVAQLVDGTRREEGRDGRTDRAAAVDRVYWLPCP